MGSYGRVSTRTLSACELTDGWARCYVPGKQVPVAVDGRVVHWIDSKATYGDESSHLNQYMDQYQQYVNRYGPGMVIYWFGYTGCGPAGPPAAAPAPRGAGDAGSGR